MVSGSVEIQQSDVIGKETSMHPIHLCPHPQDLSPPSSHLIVTPLSGTSSLIKSTSTSPLVQQQQSSSGILNNTIS